MNELRHGLASLGVGIVVSIMVACGDDRPPVAEAASSSSGNLPPNGSPDGGGSTLSDAGDGGDGGDEPACVGPALTGSVVTARLLVDDMPGDSGGAVTEGTYDLTDVAVYGIPEGDDGPAVPPDPVPAMRATLTLGAGTFDLSSQITPVGSAQPDPVLARRATYATRDEVFLATEGICPTGTSILVPYSATTTTITLHTGTRRWETFTKR